MKLFGKTMVMALMAVLALSLAVAAQGPNLALNVAKVDSAPTIDGVLDDAAWVTASTMGSKAVIDMSNDGVAVSPFPWVAYMAYDDSNLYLAYITYTKNSDLLVGEPGSLWGNDHVELFIQPAGSSYTQFGWDVNLNVNTAAEQSEVAVSKTGVQAIYEISIPFSALGVTPKAGDVWTGNLTGLQNADSGQWMCWNVAYGKFANPDRFGSFTFGE